MTGPILPRRDAPDTWYPAGVPGVVARWVTLPDGERVRAVELAGGAKPDALLLHGWGCNAFHFRRLLPALARHGIRGLALDLRGHGLSHKPADPAAYTAAALSGFVAQVLDALALEQAGLVGHSLGAAIALDVAIAAPERVRWLGLLNPVGFSRLKYAPLFKRFPLRFAENLPVAVSRAVAYAALHLAYGGLAHPDAGDLEQYLYPTLMPGGRFGMLAYAGAFTWEPRAISAIARIACPTHVFFGARDRVIRSSDAMAPLRSLTHARAHVVAGAGHVLAEESAERIAEELAGMSAADLRKHA